MQRARAAGILSSDDLPGPSLVVDDDEEFTRLRMLAGRGKPVSEIVLEERE